MDQSERRIFLIRALLDEQPQTRSERIPEDEADQRRLLRGLFNVRMPLPADAGFLTVQDAYLQEEIARRGVTQARDLAPAEEGICLWRGDITTLACDAIVNAANSQLLGCFIPGHNCIDNAIHTYAGVQLRAACARLMEQQGHEEPTGSAKLTEAFNLPCRFVLHTVGPIAGGRPTAAQEEQLASCYRACLALAAQHGLSSVAFCCISTGVFGFPAGRAAQIAVNTVRACRGDSMQVIFNVFKESDYDLYAELLG